MKYKLGCDLDYQIDSFSTFIFNFRVAQIDCQKIISEHLQLNPAIPFDEFVSPVLENRYFRVNVSPETSLRVSYRAEVEMSHFYGDPNRIMEIQPADLPKETWPYLYPSRFCQSDRLVNLALSEFGGEQMGYSRVTAICNWIFDKVYYQYGASSAHTSAFDTATERIGVCRDFAHLGIAFCRALNIPARFVSSYAYGLSIPDFHACFEAYLGGRWYLFDPTRQAPQNGVVRIGTGRDAADVSIATIFGNVSMNDMRIFIEHVPDQDCPGIPELTTEAIAIL